MYEPMTARDFFEHIRAEVIALPKAKERVSELQASLGPIGQTYGSIGHASGPKDVSVSVLAAIHAQADYEARAARHKLDLDRATRILYGRSGRGGLAKVRGYADSDCICGFYLQAMTWRQVADELVRPESRDGPQWCKRRAYRALELIDRLGVVYLENI